MEPVIFFHNFRVPFTITDYEPASRRSCLSLAAKDENSGFKNIFEAAATLTSRSFV